MNVTTAQDSGQEKPICQHSQSTPTITSRPTRPPRKQARAVEGLTQFDSRDELAKISTEWPLSRFVEVWNSIPGNTKVHKFQDRKKAVARVWKAIQPLAANSEADQPEAHPTAKKAERVGRSAKSDKPSKSQKLGKNAKGAAKNVREAKIADPPSSERTNKKAEVIAMMKRAKGVTLVEVMESTGWQKHTVRGFVSILGSKGGHTIESSKNAAGERTYRITK